MEDVINGAGGMYGGEKKHMQGSTGEREHLEDLGMTIDLKKREWEDVDWIDLAQNRDQW